MAKALIGYTGFVGGNLLDQWSFDDCFNSKNIDEIDGRHYDTVVCAGVPAAKWIANREPVKDRRNIEQLSRHLASITTGKFILISTVDVYPDAVDVDENTPIDVERCQPYGKHRLELEEFVASQFDALIVRLPGLFGKGLKKNVIYDFLHDNNTDQINPGGVFQFYCLKHLSRDIEIALDNNLKVLNITSEPTSVAEVARICLGHEFVNNVDATPARYDYQSCHTHLYGGRDGYLYSKDEILADLREFVEETREALS